VPLHAGAACVDRSPGLGDDTGFVRADLHTLQARAAPNIFAIGDATNLPTSKAGSVTHFEADALTADIQRFLARQPLEGCFDGHANCFVETGFGKALLIDFNYETEPLPGRYPFEHAGLPLMRESHVNHLGKLLFQSLYWHALLPGRDIPGIGAQLRHHQKEHA
jgi:sulfide:quinone oxidoreductase